MVRCRVVRPAGFTTAAESPPAAGACLDQLPESISVARRGQSRKSSDPACRCRPGNCSRRWTGVASPECIRQPWRSVRWLGMLIEHSCGRQQSGNPASENSWHSGWAMCWRRRLRTWSGVVPSHLGMGGGGSWCGWKCRTTTGTDMRHPGLGCHPGGHRSTLVSTAEVQGLLERAGFRAAPWPGLPCRDPVPRRNNCCADSNGRMMWYCLVRLIRMSSMVSLSLRLFGHLALGVPLHCCLRRQL